MMLQRSNIGASSGISSIGGLWKIQTNIASDCECMLHNFFDIFLSADVVGRQEGP